MIVLIIDNSNSANRIYRSLGGGGGYLFKFANGGVSQISQFNINLVFP